MPQANKKLDPEQTFVIMEVSRKKIAETLNSIADIEGWNAPKFTPDDPRLTNEVCQEIANGTENGIFEAGPVTMSDEYEYHKESLRSLLGLPEEEDDI
jgi:hypothetical protein